MAGRHRARAGVVRTMLAVVVPIVGAAAVATAVVLGSASVAAGPRAVAIPTFPSQERVLTANVVAVSATPFAVHRSSGMAGGAVAEATTAVDRRVAEQRAAEARAKAARAEAARVEAARAEAARAEAARAAAARAAAADRTPEARPAPPARTAPRTTAPPPSTTASPTPTPTPSPSPDQRPGPASPAPTEDPDDSGGGLLDGTPLGSGSLLGS